MVQKWRDHGAFWSWTKTATACWVHRKWCTWYKTWWESTSRQPSPWSTCSTLTAMAASIRQSLCSSGLVCSVNNRSCCSTAIYIQCTYITAVLSLRSPMCLRCTDVVVWSYIVTTKIVDRHDCRIVVRWWLSLSLAVGAGLVYYTWELLLSLWLSPVSINFCTRPAPFPPTPHPDSDHAECWRRLKNHWRLKSKRHGVSCEHGWCHLGFWPKDRQNKEIPTHEFITSPN